MTRGSPWILPGLLLLGMSMLLPGSVGGRGPLAAPQGASASDRRRFLELIARKRAIDREATLLKLEAELSARKKTYLILDLTARKLYFKVRGRVFKAVTLDGIELTGDSGTVEPAALAARSYTLQLKEGKGVETESIELKSLTPEEAARAGGREPVDSESSVELGAVTEGAAPARRTAGTGAPPVTQKLAGVAGGAIPPDPPPRYHLGFDGGLSVWVVASTEEQPRSAFYERVLTLAKVVGGVFRAREAGEAGTRLTLHLTLDRGQQLFRQLVCGQQLLISP